MVQVVQQVHIRYNRRVANLKPWVRYTVVISPWLLIHCLKFRHNRENWHVIQPSARAEVQPWFCDQACASMLLSLRGRTWPYQPATAKLAPIFGQKSPKHIPVGGLLWLEVFALKMGSKGAKTTHHENVWKNILLQLNFQTWGQPTKAVANADPWSNVRTFPTT